nr:MAG TPA: tail assembly chaperone protein [Caudoviricetes sp.]
MRKDMVKATREALLERASKKEDKAYSTYESEALGLAFTVKRLPVARLMAIMDMGEETAEGGLETSKQLIYESIPALQDKELQEAYGCVEPHDIVLGVFDDNLGEVEKLVEFINSQYGLTVDDIKN